jgi:hypothetical protein
VRLSEQWEAVDAGARGVSDFLLLEPATAALAFTFANDEAAKVSVACRMVAKAYLSVSPTAAAWTYRSGPDQAR